jgi:hypothetical protein
MKIRKGFVSNSSSSSFLIYGSKVSIEDIKDDVKKELAHFLNVDVDELYDIDDFSYDVVKYINEKENSEICVFCGYDDYYIGRSWDSIGDDETGKQFKESIEKTLKKYCDNDCGTLEYCGYNG